jgi:peptide-methionine (S)-S-oxide reductase
MEQATFAGGCFWCLEAIFLKLKGVEKVVSGYSGGKRENPTYEQVCSGATGHAEVVQIDFDPKVINFEQLLDVFFHIHNPTTLNKQGYDTGTQYRSAVFYHNQDQKQLTEEYIKKLELSKVWDDPIVTEVIPLEEFYAAEDYHQNYFENNPQNQYCQLVINPKVEKFYQKFKDLLK